MSYGGIEEVEWDEEHGFFYVKRENGTWNRYKIDQEKGFQNWLDAYHRSGDIPYYNLTDEGDRSEIEPKKDHSWDFDYNEDEEIRNRENDDFLW